MRKRHASQYANFGSLRKKGKKVGIAYELENGEIIYVPEE